jgi:hypothetical protein|tara:strand:+ start:229 stop:969 length:741 start_codon:yes stop_codon:yes gene_type:complete
MADKESIWSKLNSVTVEKDKKGNFDYVSWTDMWQEINTHYPEIQFEFKEFDHPVHGLMDCMIYPDGSASVHSTVTINGLTHPMWLAVTEHNSKTYKKDWNVVDIANTKMRCLTKNISLFGLGAYVYRGEDIADREAPTAVVKLKPKAKKEEVIEMEDIPQDAPILYEGKAWTTEFFVESFKGTLDSDLKPTTKEGVTEMWQGSKEQFKLLSEHDSIAYDDLIKLLAKTKADLPNREITTEENENGK